VPNPDGTPRGAGDQSSLRSGFFTEDGLTDGKSNPCDGRVSLAQTQACMIAAIKEIEHLTAVQAFRPHLLDPDRLA
jgi:hypothetical protein